MKNVKNISDSMLASLISDSERELQALKDELTDRRRRTQAELAKTIKGLSAHQRLDACLTPIGPSEARKMMTYGIKAAAAKKVVAWYTRRSLSGENLTTGLYAKSKNGTIYRYGRKFGILGDLFKVA